MQAHLTIWKRPDDQTWVRLYIHRVGDRWATMLLADEEPPQAPGAMKGLAFFGATPQEAEQAAKVYLGCAEPAY